jgi:hypothetical protein
MDHRVGFTDGSLSTRWPSAFSVHEFQSQRELVVNRRNHRQGA